MTRYQTRTWVTGDGTVEAAIIDQKRKKVVRRFEENDDLSPEDGLRARGTFYLMTDEGPEEAMLSVDAMQYIISMDSFDGKYAHYFSFQDHDGEFHKTEDPRSNLRHALDKGRMVPLKEVGGMATFRNPARERNEVLP